ncbi:MAG: class I SAM-dependent methyltransferase [Acidimicrobiales bacterium]
MATRPGGGDAPHEGPDYWDGIMEAWEPSPANQLWRAHSDAVNTGLIRRWLEPGRGVVVKTDLFDEAVGQGVFPELAERADRVVGVDVSPRVVRVALERFPGLCGVVAGVEALPFGDGTVDTVFSNSTLDHFASHAQLRLSAAELARVVRPGGRLLVTLDNRANPVVALRTQALSGLWRRLGLVPYFVGATYGVRGLVRLLEQVGFDVVRSAAVMHAPPQLLARRAARRRAVAPDVHLRSVLPFEVMADWPTARLTGHFAAALAVRRAGPVTHPRSYHSPFGSPVAGYSAPCRREG